MLRKIRHADFESKPYFQAMGVVVTPVNGQGPPHCEGVANGANEGMWICFDIFGTA